MIINNIKNAGFFQINTIRAEPRGNRNLVVFLILSDDDEKKKKNKNIKKIIDGYALDKDNNLDEFIIITEKSEFLKSAFIKLMTELKSNEIARDFHGEKAIYNAYPYHNFLYDIPNHISVSRHKIMEEQEIQDNLFSEYINKHDIYIIYEYDPPIVWLGGRDGQIVEVIRLSSTSMEAPVYRLIKFELYKPK
jgi:DNA-directed RNA polymerase subunit H (RpoH/RPB5)